MIPLNSTSNRLIRATSLMLMVLVISLYVIRQMYDGPFGKDFTIFLTGAHILTSGQGAELYDLSVQTKVQTGLAGNIRFEGGVLPFNYPPYIAMLFSPLTFFGPAEAYYIWVAVQWAVVLALAFSIRRYFHNRHGMAATPIVMTMFSFVPVFEALLMGQMSLILLSLWWWAFVSWRHERWGQLGVAIALSAFKPQLVVLLVAGLVAQKRWKVLGYTTIMQAVLWGVSILLTGPQTLLSYIHILQISSSSIDTLGFFGKDMTNLRGLLTVSGVGPELSIQLAMFFWALSVGAAIWLWRRPWPIATRFGLTVVLSVLFSPHLYTHDAALLVLGVVCASVACIERGMALNLRWLLAPLIAMFVALYSVVFSISHSWAPVILATWLFGIVVFAWLMHTRRSVTVPSVEIGYA